MKSYPLFIPPDPLNRKKAKSWTLLEAKTYFDWIKSIYVKRTNELLDYFAQPFPSIQVDRAGFLNNLGSMVATTLKEKPFSSDANGEIELSPMGAALAADIGLLVARFLHEEGTPKIYWELITQPPSDVDFHLPVLSGFEGGTYIDFVGTSIRQSRAIIASDQSPAIWSKIYRYWKQQIPGE